MRAHRVRFTKEKAPKVTKTHSGVMLFLQNRAGQAAKKERLWDQWVSQQRVCPRCEKEMDLSDSQFAYRSFKEGEVNQVVHKACAKH
jgi:hypothetical protein